jgi:hypothetical protein
MKANEATWDRIVRALLGIGLLYLPVAGVTTGTWGIVLGIVGVILFVTGLVGWCPLYALLKFSTKKA